MRKILLATALVFPMAAGATEVRTNVIASPTQTSVNHNTNVNNNNAVAGAIASSRAHSTSSSRSFSSSNGESNVNIDNSRQDRRQAPGLGAYAAASGPCTGVSTMAGLSIPGFGGQVGRTEIEDECQLREAARLAYAMGDGALAMALIRSLPSVRKALTPPAVATVQPTPQVTQTPVRATTRPTANGFAFNN